MKNRKSVKKTKKLFKKIKSKLKPRGKRNVLRHKARRNKKLVKKPKKVLFKKILKKSGSRKKYRAIKVKKAKVKKVSVKKVSIKRKKVSVKKKRVLLKRKKVLVKRVLVKRKKVSKKRKIIRLKPEGDFLTKSFFKAKIKVIGIGGGGGSIVSEIGGSLDKAKFVIADTDSRVLKKRRGIKYFLFGQELTHGLGTGLNPSLGKMAAEQEKEKITDLFKDQDMLIFIASLGGGVGSGATPVFTEISQNFDGVSFGIFTLPFKFEGKNKYNIAFRALRQLRSSLNVSIVIANEKIFKIIDSNTPITEAFSLVNKNLIESLENLIDLIYNLGIINIDFADLRTILKGKGNLAFLNTAEVSGKDKLEEISQKILHNPLYQNNNFTAQKILFNIAGGRNLSMFEVDKISKMIAEQNPKAKIIFGISKNSDKNKIKVTILMVGLPTVKDNVISRVPVAKPLKIISKVVKKIKKIKIKKKKNKNPIRTVLKNKEKISSLNIPMPVFNNIPISIGDSVKSSFLEESQNQKKTIRRTALDIKKNQEVEENKKSEQEKEWDIPAFLRLKK